MRLQNLNKHSHTIKLLNDRIDLLLKEQKTKEDIVFGIEQLQKDIARIKRKLTGGDYPYSYCEIEFDGEYELDLPKYGAEEFKRVLKGRMYFNIVGGSEEGKYMYIQTNSFPDNFKIHLTYKSIETFEMNQGRCSLIYKDVYSGNEEKVYFIIKKLR